MTYGAPKPITIYTSEPIKLEQVVITKPEPTTPKPTVEPIAIYMPTIIHTVTEKQVEKKVEKQRKEPEVNNFYNLSTLPSEYSVYGPYNGMFATKPVAVVERPVPLWYYRMKMFYHFLG